MAAIKIYNATTQQWEYVSTAGKSAYQQALDGGYPFDENTFNESLAMLRINGDGTKALFDDGTYKEIIMEEDDPIFTAWKNGTNLNAGLNSIIGNYNNNNISLGFNNNVWTGNNNIVLGKDNNIGDEYGNAADNNIIIGTIINTQSIGNYNISIGLNNSVGSGSIVIGRNSSGLGISIGNGVIVETQSSVGIGHSSTSGPYSYVVSVGNETNQRRIIYVADGINLSDAATVGQLTNSLGNYVLKTGDTMTGTLISRNIIPVSSGFSLGSTTSLWSNIYSLSVNTYQIIPSSNNGSIGASNNYWNNSYINIGNFNNINVATIATINELYIGNENTNNIVYLQGTGNTILSSSSSLYLRATMNSSTAGIIIDGADQSLRPTSSSWTLGSTSSIFSAVYTNALYFNNINKTNEINAIIINGDGNSFLSNDGTYKSVSVDLSNYVTLDTDQNVNGQKIFQHILVENSFEAIDSTLLILGTLEAETQAFFKGGFEVSGATHYINFISTFGPSSGEADFSMYVQNGVFEFGSEISNRNWNFNTGTSKLQYNGVEVATVNDIPNTSNFVTTSGEQTVNGIKTFTSRMYVSSSGGYNHIIPDTPGGWARAFEFLAEDRVTNYAAIGIYGSGTTGEMVPIYGYFGVNNQTYNASTLRIYETNINIAGDILPRTTNTGQVGSSTSRWSSVFALTADFNTVSSSSSSGLTLSSSANSTNITLTPGFSGNIIVGGSIFSSGGSRALGDDTGRFGIFGTNADFSGNVTISGVNNIIGNLTMTSSNLYPTTTNGVQLGHANFRYSQIHTTELYLYNITTVTLSSWLDGYLGTGGIGIAKNPATSVASGAIVLGTGNTASNNSSIVIGHGAQNMSGTYSITIGNGASTLSGYSITIGRNASSPSSGYAIAIGDSATANTGIAIGTNASVTHSDYNCIAIGFDSTVTPTDWAPSPTDDETRGVVSFGNSTISVYRKIINVAAGQGDHDVVNMSQLNALETRIATLESTISTLNQQLEAALNGN